MDTSFTIALIFLIIAVILIIVIVIYNLFWRPIIPATSCQNNNNCGAGQVCQGGVCVEITCTSDSDCSGNGICIDSFCTAFTCLSGNDCPINTACTSGNCVRIGNTCQTNADCFELSCMNGVCVQCIMSSSCPIGQGCLSGICQFPNVGDTGVNLINYSSIAQENGNITAPPGYFCPVAVCGTGPTGTDPISCDGGTGFATLCPSSCPFCINSVCRCAPGANLEPCRANGDCASGICGATELGQVCIPPGGECIANFNGTGGIRVCPVSRPYCVNGTCSTVSLGAVCGATGSPPDLCNNPQALGVIGTTGITPDGMGFFCVNGTCQENPGPLNALCTPGSCEFIENGVLVCRDVPSESIPQMRCLRV